MTTAQTLPRMMFVRDTQGVESHMANSWTSMAMCGAVPSMRTIGWTLGTESGLHVAAVCTECQEAYRDMAESLAAINADRR